MEKEISRVVLQKNHECSTCQLAHVALAESVDQSEASCRQALCHRIAKCVLHRTSSAELTPRSYRPDIIHDVNKRLATHLLTWQVNGDAQMKYRFMLQRYGELIGKWMWQLTQSPDRVK
jgi:hypothetical protein